MRFAVAILLVLASPLAAQAQPPAAAPAAAAGPVTVEYYYRIRWGSFWDFMDIYRQHHAPILAEMQRLGFITAIRTDVPVMHMVGDARWDLRVSITFRDSNAATVDPAYGIAERAASERLFPDRARHLAEETRRFSMIEEHWDVIVAPYSE